MTDTIKKLLTPILPKFNISDYIININAGSAKGDGYAGDIYSVNVKHKNGDLDLIVKIAAKDETTRKDLHSDIIFRNEINLYTKIFPEMDLLQKEKRVSNPLEMTKCYNSSLIKYEEAIILENLKTKQYKHHPMKQAFDKAHVVLVLKQYAKFHALSFALRSQRSEIFKKITEYTTNVAPSMYPNFIDAIKLQMRKCAEMLKCNGLIKEGEAAEKLAEEAENILYLNEEPNEYTTIVHGDCWCNNMMFKYDVVISALIYFQIYQNSVLGC